MAGQTINLAKFVGKLEIELTGANQCRVIAWRIVPLGAEIDIIARHSCEEKPADDIETAETAAYMTGAGPTDHVERVQATHV
ncbi:hypothetical protein ACC771_21145, partial [Rhizobium ruizarguesonis]